MKTGHKIMTQKFANNISYMMPCQITDIHVTIVHIYHIYKHSQLD